MEYALNVIKGFVYAVSLLVVLARAQPAVMDIYEPPSNISDDFSATNSANLAANVSGLPVSTTNTRTETPPTPPSSPASTPTPTISNTPSPTPSPTPQPGGDKYQFEAHPSGEEGFFVIKNAPVEAMSTEDELMEALNNYRRTHNLSTLNRDEGICQIAQRRAQEASQEFSHNKFQESVQNGDYNHVSFTRISENLWDGSFTGVHIVEFGWDRSAGHRANMQGEWSRGCPGINGTTAVFIFAN